MRKSKKVRYYINQRCFRCTVLAKRYGFHFNEDKKVSLSPRENTEYQVFSDDDNLTKVNTMRSKREK